MPKQLEAHGLTKGQAGLLSDRILRLVAAEYTREAGVRGLERQIAALCRKTATQIATGRGREGARRRGEAARVARARAGSPARRGGAPRTPGVATGLAYTTVGGDVLFIEATAYPGRWPPLGSPASSAR